MQTEPLPHNLLDDVPQMSGGVEPEQSVVDGHLMEAGALLVPKERIRNPDVVPASFAQTNLGDLHVLGDESLVAPVLS